MGSVPRARRWATIAGLLALTAGVAISGCSSFGSDSSWDGDTASIEGVVTSDRGVALPEIKVELWTEFESSGEEVWYETETDENGWFSVDDMELESTHDHYETYRVFVNRTWEESAPLNAGFATYWADVTVHKSGTTWNVVLELIDDGPEDPESYFDL